jgi:hypothetical protein
MKKQDDAYVTRIEAAAMLEVDPRTLSLWVREGRLKAYTFQKTRKVFFLKVEVQSVMLARAEKNMDIWKVHSIALTALSTAQRAERRLTSLLEQLGLDTEPLPRDDASLRELYLEAQKGVLSSEARDADWLKFWAGAFFTMDEVYLELVERMSGDEEPWKVFIDFANSVTRNLVEGGYPVQVASAVQRFDAGKRNLLHTGYMYCRRVHGRKVANGLFNGRASAVDELMSLLH